MAKHSHSRLIENSWDEQQTAVITARANQRTVVRAGPGTGKTAVACKRLAHLIANDSIEPSNILMISFTNTAVNEIVGRLYKYIGNDAYSVKVSTIDSQAWMIYSGHDEQAKLTNSYNRNIEHTNLLMKTDEDVQDELTYYEHIVIDEAQDIVGVRTDFLNILLEYIHPNCGITIFCDEAQAIYNFSDENDRNLGNKTNEKPSSFLDQLKVQANTNWTFVELVNIYRTSSQNLVKLFSGLRQHILEPSNHQKGLFKEAVQSIQVNSDQQLNDHQQVTYGKFSSDDLILFRTRSEVLSVSQFCNFPHKIRMSGYGRTLPAWLAICFWDYDGTQISKNVFFDLWESRIYPISRTPVNPIKSWKKLLRVAGNLDGNLNMHTLRSKLSRKPLPTDLSVADFGLKGPTLSTIHASKGREAKNTLLHIPVSRSFKFFEDELDETRVLFVGATRAAESLKVVDGANTFSSKKLRSGRVYRFVSKEKGFQIEIGREYDLSATGLVGKNLKSKTECLAAQKYLATVTHKISKFNLKWEKSNGGSYRMYGSNASRPIATFSSLVRQEILAVRELRKNNKTLGLSDTINHVVSQGCSTLVLAPDNSELEYLHEPWSSSGFVLAPKICAYPIVYFEI